MLCSVPVLQKRIPFGQIPFPPPLRRPWRTRVFVRGLLRYYGTVRLPVPCIAVVLHRIHGTGHYAIRNGRSQDIPVPVRETCMRAQGLRPREVRIPLAITRHSMLPSASLDASAPRRRVFSRLNTRPTCPLSTLHSRPYVRLRMTRGRCGSLFLHRMRLSLTISRRSSPAHQGLTPLNMTPLNVFNYAACENGCTSLSSLPSRASSATSIS